MFGGKHAKNKDYITFNGDFVIIELPILPGGWYEDCL